METQDCKAARAALAAKLEVYGFTLEARPIDSRPDRVVFDKHAGHYAYTVRAKGHEYSGVYSVGSGILARWAGENRPKPGNGFPAWDPAEFRAPRYSLGRLTVYQVEKLAIVRERYRPDLVDVVASMISDTIEYEPDCTFREWCDNSGMEWKSPADALDAFEAIRAEARFLARVLTVEQRAELLELAGEI